MIESPEAQFQYALKLPMQELVSIMRGKPSQVSQSVAMMAMQKLNATKTAMQGQQARQQLNKPSVKDQLVQESQMPENQGIGQLPAQNMNEVVHAAQGGIIGFAEGGGAWEDLAPYDPAKDVRREEGAFEPLMRTLRLGDYASAGQYRIDPATGEKISLGEFMRRGEKGPRVASTQGEPEPTQYAQPPTAPGPQAPRPAAPMRGAPAPLSTRVPSTQGEPEQMQYGPTSTQGIAALAPAPTVVPRTQETFEELQKKFSSTTKPYMDEMTAAMKALTDSPEEKNARGEKRTGIMLMKAAQQLLAGGRSGAASRGAALGSVGDLAQEYAKEDDAAKRAQIGAKITMLGAQAQLAQGDNKAAMDMFQHAQNLDQKYAHLEATKAQHAAEIASKEKGHDIDRQKMEGEQAYRRETIRIMEPLNQAHAQYYRALGAAGGARGQLTPKDLANFRDKATDNVRASLDKNPVLQAKANKDPALMRQLVETEFANLMQNKTSALQPAPSIQLPDSAADGRRVIE